MDTLIVARKLDSLQRCLVRVHDKCPTTADILAATPDLQDIVVLNLSRAVQLCVDLALHVLADSGLPPPDTMGQAFDQLASTHSLDASLATRLRKAVGFRNLAVRSSAASTGPRCAPSPPATRHLSDFTGFTAWIAPQKADEAKHRNTASHRHFDEPASPGRHVMHITVHEPDAPSP